MKYETTMNESREAFKEVRAIMAATGAMKVRRRNGKIYLDDSTEPWDGKSRAETKETFERLNAAELKIL